MKCLNTIKNKCTVKELKYSELDLKKLPNETRWYHEYTIGHFNSFFEIMDNFVSLFGDGKLHKEDEFYISISEIERHEYGYRTIPILTIKLTIEDIFNFEKTHQNKQGEKKMNFPEALVIIFCTPFGWIGIFMMGMFIIGICDAIKKDKQKLNYFKKLKYIKEKNNAVY